MKRLEEYAGIDIFRMIAALLIIAIHTSPLASFSETADFGLTRIAARVAVPFFFMATGFFVLTQRKNTIGHFLKKTAILYSIATIIYFPINIYAGNLDKKPFFPQLLKDIVFDGTFYHLWYLPAAMLGIVIADMLLKKCSTGQALGISAVLYAVGLFGDSYYGIIRQIPIMKAIYDRIFWFSDYTRNGLFFAPIFFIMGALLARQKGRCQLKGTLIGLFVTTMLLFIEGFVLHIFKVQRHDSMYFMLPVCMLFLFQALLFWKGHGHKNLRQISSIVYIIHPLMIILIRGFAKITHLQRFLIENSLIHYFAVAVSSCVVAVVISWILRTIKKPPENMQTDRVWAEISLNKLSHNVNELKKVLPEGCCFMAVVKANAYGHGDVQLAKHLNHIGVNSFAVATIDEGIHLRKHKIKGEILILGYTSAQRVAELHCYHLIQTVVDYHHAKELNAAGYTLKVHLKIDTGMHRLGEDYKAVQEIKQIFKCQHLQVCGIFSHLCVSDSSNPEDVTFTHQQIEKFEWLLKQLKESDLQLPKVHIQSSYGVLNYPELQYDYARIGIAMYGAMSAPNHITKVKIDLQPVMEIHTKIILIREVAAGESVSYGRTFTAKQNTRVAVLPVGYADGLPRTLSGGSGQVLVHGRYAPIVGRICMDQLLVDVTEISFAKVGDVATLIGSDQDAKITAEQVAENAGTITNELFSRLGSRINRIYY